MRGRPRIELALAAALIFMALAGGGDAGRYVTVIRGLNAALGAVFVVVWLRRAPTQSDLVDRLVLGSLLFFLLTCVTSQFTRDSFDAATSATAFAAVLYVARGAVTTDRARDLGLAVLGLLGITLSVVFLVLWGAVWVRWLSIPGAGLPSLDLILPVGPFRHYHVVGTTVAVLIPAVVTLARRPVIWPAGVIGLAASLAVVFMSGSRTAWLALAAGVTLTTAPFIVPALRRVPRVAWLVVGAAVAALIVGGIAQPLVTRLTGTSTISLRGAIWDATLDRWLAHPLVGSGPGSFSATFTLSGFFDAYDGGGRHADNAIIQLLAEAGLTGIAALGSLVGAVVVGVRNVGFRWAPAAGLAIFAFASLTDNPSDSAHLVIIAIAWMALATPRTPSVDERPARRGYLLPAMVAAGVIGVATASTLAASWAYDQAAAANERGDATQVVEPLRLASALDPSLALYQRELGVWLLAGGDADGALAHLARATELNPADATALRAEAVAFVTSGHPERGLAPARQAVELRGIDAENQVTLAWVAIRTANGGEEASAALTAAVQPWPWITASPAWSDLFGTGEGLAFLLESAERSWPDALVATGRYDVPRAWLTAMTGQTAADILSAKPALLVIGCELDAAADAAAAMGRSEAASTTGLISRIIVARATGAPDNDQLAAANLRWPLLAILATNETPAASPFVDQVEDTRLYRRLTMPAPDFGPLFPTADAGLSAWLRDPVAAAKVGAPASGLANCR